MGLFGKANVFKSELCQSLLDLN